MGSEKSCLGLWEGRSHKLYDCVVQRRGFQASGMNASCAGPVSQRQYLPLLLFMERVIINFKYNILKKGNKR